MLKFLAIIFIVGYVTFKLGGFIMKMLYTAMGQEPPKKNFNNQSKRKPGSNVDVDTCLKTKKEENPISKEENMWIMRT